MTPAPISPQTQPAESSLEAGDAVLIERFLKSQDNAAFETLLRRHGGMVMGLLRRLSLQEADAEDAFQATFLTFARKAGAIGNRGSVASWLYTVAYRIAGDLRGRALKRRGKEQALTGNELAEMKTDVTEFWSMLDAELHKLPEKYRVPFVLCHLEGWSLARAAEQIGCAQGTVGSRLARARQWLRTRLARRGLALSATTLAGYLSQSAAQASVSEAVLQSTLQTTLSYHGGAAATVAPQVAALSDRAVQALFVAKVKFLALLSVVLVALTVAAALVIPHWLNRTPSQEVVENQATQEPEDEDWLAHWGTVIDPEGDTRFRATRKLLTITTPERPVVFGDALKNAPRVMRDVRGDFVLQVRVMPPDQTKPPSLAAKELFLAGGAANVLNTIAFQSASVLVVQNDERFVKFGGGLFHDKDGPNARLMALGKHQGPSKIWTAPAAEPTAFQYLRVQRLGPHLFASFSGDGERWEYAPMVTDENLAGELKVGLLAEHNGSRSFAATFAEHKLVRFSMSNNPQSTKVGPAPPKGCARCHGDETPKDKGW